MKTLFKTICVIGLLLWAPSCKDFLTEDPKGRLATVYFFDSAADLDLALNSLYFNVARTLFSNGFTGTNLLAGDDISTHPAMGKEALREYDQYDVYDNNAWMPLMWESKWRIVKNANFIINNAGRTPDVDPEEIQYVIAQAHYWRAFAYFYMVRTWGPLPIMLEEKADNEATLDPVEDVYDLIVSDLKIAEGCRINYTREPYVINGRNIAVCQAAAKATLAYVYLNMAGWQLNKGTEYYQLAADKAREIIDGVENGVYNYELLDEYWQIHSWTTNNNHPEVILAAYYNRDVTDNGSGSPCPDFLFDMIQGGWGDTNGEIKFWKDFPEGPRKDMSYVPQLMLLDGNLYDWWYDTDPPSREVVAPVFMKTQQGADRFTDFDYTDPRQINDNGDKSHKIILLSEVYCWYAEAVGRSGQTNAKAIEVLNKVRNRADGFGPVADRSTVGVPDRPHIHEYVNKYPSSMTPNELAEAAYDEHGWEVAGYYWGNIAARYWDMFRMNRVKDHFEYRKLNPMIEVAPGIFRNEKVPVTGTWSDSKMYAPYPSIDSNLNPNLAEANTRR